VVREDEAEGSDATDASSRKIVGRGRRSKSKTGIKTGSKTGRRTARTHESARGSTSRLSSMSVERATLSSHGSRLGSQGSRTTLNSQRDQRYRERLLQKEKEEEEEHKLEQQKLLLALATSTDLADAAGRERRERARRHPGTCAL
jgi:hypothetical protein